VVAEAEAVDEDELSDAGRGVERIPEDDPATLRDADERRPDEIQFPEERI
jgi:hypothetical protein